jgi:hypothetical protein
MKMPSALAIGLILAVCARPQSQNEQNRRPRIGVELIVSQIMSRSLARCRTVQNGVITKIEWRPPREEDFAEIQSLGDRAVPSLSHYLDSRKEGDFAQLMAVKFLIASNSPRAEVPLERALETSLWEVTRAQALSGLFELSRDDALPFVRASLNDQSQLVRDRAQELFKLYSKDQK